MITKETHVEEIAANAALLNVITPMGLEFKRNSLVIGENSGRVYGVVKYPQKVDYGRYPLLSGDFRLHPADITTGQVTISGVTHPEV